MSANGTGATTRERPSNVISGFLATGAIFLACYGILARPVRIEPAAAVVALVAVGMAGQRQRRLAAYAVGFVAAGFVLGMTVAVLTSHPLW